MTALGLTVIADTLVALDDTQLLRNCRYDNSTPFEQLSMFRRVAALSLARNIIQGPSVLAVLNDLDRNLAALVLAWDSARIRQHTLQGATP